MSGIRRPTNRAQQLRREATPAERRLWNALGAGRVGHKFSRQMPVGPYICDFLCRSARLAVELDGYSHDLTVERDAKRQAFLRSRRITMLRFTNAEIMTNLEGVVHAVAEALAAAPPPTPPASGRGEEA